MLLSFFLILVPFSSKGKLGTRVACVLYFLGCKFLLFLLFNLITFLGILSFAHFVETKNMHPPCTSYSSAFSSCAHFYLVTVLLFAVRTIDSRRTSNEVPIACSGVIMLDDFSLILGMNKQIKTSPCVKARI